MMADGEATGGIWYHYDSGIPVLLEAERPDTLVGNTSFSAGVISSNVTKRVTSYPAWQRAAQCRIRIQDAEGNFRKDIVTTSLSRADEFTVKSIPIRYTPGKEGRSRLAGDVKYQTPKKITFGECE